MDRDELKKILPHREPMLLLDDAELVDGVSIAHYHVTGDEFFLQGHFPGNPVVPGVILCEMMAQSACLLTGLNAKERGALETGEACTPYYTGISNVRFRRKVLPGDRVELKAELLKAKGIFYFVKAEGRVDGEICVSGELSFALVKGE